MQNRPDHPTLLDAITRFLLEELTPTLAQNKAMQFRVLIAANLASIVGNELRSHAQRFSSEGARLASLLGAPVPGSDAELEALNERLTDKLRSGEIDEGAALEHLLQTARETLATTNPRFDLSAEIEK